jgi:hypothetical protein
MMMRRRRRRRMRRRRWTVMIWNILRILLTVKYDLRIFKRLI